MVIKISAKINQLLTSKPKSESKVEKGDVVFSCKNSELPTVVEEPSKSKTKEIFDMVKRWSENPDAVNKKEINQFLKNIEKFSNEELLELLPIFKNAVYSEMISSKDRAGFFETMKNEIRNRLIAVGAVVSNLQNSGLEDALILVNQLEKINLKESFRAENLNKNIAYIEKSNQNVRQILDNTAKNVDMSEEEVNDIDSWFNKNYLKKNKPGSLSEEEFVRRMKGNGFIDEDAWQVIGNCWAHSEAKSMVVSETGRDIINSHIKKVKGGHLIYLGKAAKKGLPKDGTPGVFFVTEKEVFKKGSVQSVGDGDLTALLLAMEKYMVESGDYSLSSETESENIDIIRTFDNALVEFQRLDNTNMAIAKEKLVSIKNEIISIYNDEKLIGIFDLAEQAIEKNDPVALNDAISSLREDISLFRDMVGTSNPMHGNTGGNFYEILTGIENPDGINLSKDKDIPIGISNKIVVTKGSRALDSKKTIDDNMYARLKQLHSDGRTAYSVTFKTSSDWFESYAHESVDGPIKEGTYPFIVPGHAVSVVKMSDDFVWLNESNNPDVYIRVPKEVFQSKLRDISIMRYY